MNCKHDYEVTGGQFCTICGLNYGKLSIAELGQLRITVNANALYDAMLNADAIGLDVEAINTQAAAKLVAAIPIEVSWDAVKGLQDVEAFNNARQRFDEYRRLRSENNAQLDRVTYLKIQKGAL
jgi:phosphoribosylaminoimidazole carboxylase (NCAIR synthetase)